MRVIESIILAESKYGACDVNDGPAHPQHWRAYRLIERQRFNCEIRRSTAVDGRSMVIALEVDRGGKWLFDVTDLRERPGNRIFLAVLRDPLEIL